MANLKQIQESLSEAEVYLRQGLLVEAKDVYLRIADEINQEGVDPAIRGLLDGIDKKLVRLDDEIEYFTQSEAMPELSENLQNKIVDTFSSSQMNDGEENRFKGAVALADFKQYERAIVEFKSFLDSRKYKVRAAEYILKCLIGSSDVDRAVDCYKGWEDKSFFSFSELESIRLFLLKRYFYIRGMKGLDFDE